MISKICLYWKLYELFVAHFLMLCPLFIIWISQWHGKLDFLYWRTRVYWNIVAKCPTLITSMKGYHNEILLRLKVVVLLFLYPLLKVPPHIAIRLKNNLAAFAWKWTFVKVNNRDNFSLSFIDFNLPLFLLFLFFHESFLFFWIWNLSFRNLFYS